MSDACLLYFENAISMYKAIEFTEKGVGYKIMNNMARSIIIMNKFTALTTLSTTHVESRLEAIKVGEEMITLFDEMRVWGENDPYCRGRNLKTSTSMEIETCQHLARLYCCARSPRNDRKVIIYSQRAISACKEAGEDDRAKQLEQILETQRAKFSRKYDDIREEREFAQSEANLDLPTQREYYNTIVSDNGENSADAVAYGKNLALALMQSG